MVPAAAYGLNIAKLDFRPGSEGHVHLQIDVPVPLDPADVYHTQRRVHRSLAAHELSGQPGFYTKALPAAVQRLKPRQRAVEPGAYGSVHGVAVAVHAPAVLKLETFPHGSGFILQHPAPGGVFLTGDKRVGVVRMAVIRQHVQQVFCAEIARGETVAGCPQRIAEPVCDPLAVRFRRQTEPQLWFLSAILFQKTS